MDRLGNLRIFNLTPHQLCYPAAWSGKTSQSPPPSLFLGKTTYDLVQDHQMNLDLKHMQETEPLDPLLSCTDVDLSPLPLSGEGEGDGGGD